MTAGAIVVGHVGLSPSTVPAGGAALISVTPRYIESGLVTAPASAWAGTGPYAQAIVLDHVAMSDEAVAYVDHNATVEQRMAEFNGVIRATVVSDGTVQLRALVLRPSMDLPVRVLDGSFPFSTTVSVPVSAWTGTGPWLATVTVSESLRSAVCGPVETTTDAQALQIGRSAMHVCGISGKTVVVRAMLERPAIAVTLGISGL